MRSNTAMSVLALGALTSGSVALPLTPAGQIAEVRFVDDPAQATPTVIVHESLGEVTDEDFTVLSASDIAMLEFALQAPVDDLDYSAFYADE